MIQMGMRLLREYQGEDDRTVALLNALRPFLKGEPPGQAGPGADLPAGPGDPGPLPRHGRRGAGRCITAISPRMVLIPGWWSRTARRRGPGVWRPIRPPERGSRGRTGPGAPQDPTRGGPGRARRRRPPVRPGSHRLWRPGGPALRGEEPAERPVRRGQGGDQRHPESPPAGGAGQRDILLILIILLLLVEGDNMDLVITLGCCSLLGLADDRKEGRSYG